MRLATILLVVSARLAAVTIATAHVDNSRTGANTAETTLTPANVVSMIHLGSFATDGFVYAQPLYIPGLTVNGGTHTCLIVATMHNTISCFDAATNSGAALWSVSMGATLPLASTPNGGLLYGTEVGCVSTPVADPGNNLLYAVCSTSTPNWVLYKLNLSTGATISSVTLAATGFSAARHLQRSALTLANSKVYVCFGSYADASPWYGWIMSYDASALTQSAFFRTSTSHDGAGLWGASGGPSVDGGGNLYMFTGNGTYDGVTEWGESALKWDSSLSLTDWYTPSNWSSLNGTDSDLSSARMMLVPGTALAVGCAKDYNVYSLNTASLGHLGGTAQVFATNGAGVISEHSGCYGGTFINGNAYFPNTAGKIYGFALSGTTFNTTPFTTSASFAFPGATLSSSSNGASNTIIWATTVATSAENAVEPVTLRAFDASLNQLYSDTPSANLSKFALPVVADGRVFVATQSNLILIYGLPAGGGGGSTTARGGIGII